jgi:DNA-damage-inducible protein J
MAKTSTVYMRIDPDVKSKTEAILVQLGITPNEAINMFFNQIILQKGLPFAVKVPQKLTKAEAKAILMSKLQEAEEEETWLSLDDLDKLIGTTNEGIGKEER